MNWLKELEGKEIWTDSISRFDERVCVGVENGKIWCDGKKYSISSKEAAALFDDYFEQEFGYKPGSKQFYKSLEDEFGT